MSFDLKLQNGDLSLSNKNDLAIVEENDKLMQDIMKIISTPLGANGLYPWYGSPITQSLIGTAFESNFISNIATVQLRSSLETLQNLQIAQAKTNQIVTPQEQIAAVQNVNVDRNLEDPRFFEIVLTVLSKAFRQTTTTLQVQL
jgi:phage baseplate assembly protein W